MTTSSSSETTEIDPLSQLFARLELRAQGLAQMLVLNPPWGIAVPAAYRQFNMYSVRSGDCVLEIQGEAPIQLFTGDAALILRNKPHSVHDGTSHNLKPLAYWLKHSAAGKCREDSEMSEADTTRLISETFTLRGMLGCSFATALGDCVLLRAEDDSAGSPHQHLFSLLCREGSAPRPGSAFVYSRLMELFFVEFLRNCALKQWDNGQSNILKVLFDPQLLKVLQLVHQDPGRPWTVASMARAAGMSRTAFAVRFTRLGGITPLAYVTKWRMATAEELLEKGCTLGEVSARIGYESEAAFARAFKRHSGNAPGAVRRKPQRKALV